MDEKENAFGPEHPALDGESRRFLKFVKDSGRPELHLLTVPEARAAFAKGQAIVPVTHPEAQIESRTIPAGPSGSLLIYIVRPPGKKTTLPAVMYFHGGGWVVGDFSTHERAVREIATGAKAAVIFVEYSRSPEARFPVANEEAYSATRWVADHSSELGIIPGKLAVAGDSAGGNMATMAAIMAKQRGGPQLCAQVMIYPATGGNSSMASRHEFASGFYLSAETSLWFWKHYIGDASREIQATACPLLIEMEKLTGLPPALVITAECDMLRDEGEAYARKLTEAGVRVAATRYLGTLHGFTVNNALAESAATKAALAQVCNALREVFKS